MQLCDGSPAHIEKALIGNGKSALLFFLVRPQLSVCHTTDNVGTVWQPMPVARSVQGFDRGFLQICVSTLVRLHANEESPLALCADTAWTLTISMQVSLCVFSANFRQRWRLKFHITNHLHFIVDLSGCACTLLAYLWSWISIVNRTCFGSLLSDFWATRYRTKRCESET